MFRVAKAAPYEEVMAAICASRSLMGRPRVRRAAAICANARAAALSNGKMRPKKASPKIAAISLCNAARRRPAGIRAKPVENFGFANRCREEIGGRLFDHPTPDRVRRLGAQGLGKDIRVEHDHSLKAGGSRVAPLR